MKFAIARSRGRLIAVVSSLVLIVAAGIFAFRGYVNSNEIHQSAYFTAAKGIYEGDDVRILGYKVGSIDSVSPSGARVKIAYHYDSKYKVPANARVALIAPSVVASRFIQLAWAPAQNHGPYLADNATIDVTRTAVPLEFDDVKVQLTKLARALGQTGVNSKGALNRLIDTADRNLAGGNAQLLHDTITKLGTAVDTLNNSKGDLFGTIKNLNSFISNLNENDAALRQFSTDLLSASEVLRDDRRSLAVTLDTVKQVFKTITDFLKQNRATVKQSTVSLAQFTQTIAYTSHDLAEILHVAPTAADNFFNIYDQRYNSLNGRVAPTNFSGTPANLICGAILGVVSVGTAASLCKQALSPLAGLLDITKGLPLPGNPGPLSHATTKSASNGATTTNPVQQTSSSVNRTVTGLLGLLLPGGTK